MAAIHITDIEAAINWWRERKPSPDGVTLAPELRALAEVYALLVYHHEDEAAEAGFPAQAYAAWKAWYDDQPDTPCIAICSTSQGDPERVMPVIKRMEGTLLHADLSDEARANLEAAIGGPLPTEPETPPTP